MRWMDRWATRAQRKADERRARWQEKARSGRMTVMDRWAARAQRKADQRMACWRELEPLRRLVTDAPIEGPGDSAAVISVDQTGARWLTRSNHGGGGGGGGMLVLVGILITEAIWWLVFHRTYTVHVRTNDQPPLKMHVRLPSEIAAYRAAAKLVSRFQGDGPAALPSWRADVTTSI